MSALEAWQVREEGSPYRSVARSHVGLVRTINEDRVLDQSGDRLWAIADGLGGHDGGDVAAQMVVDSLRMLGRTCGRLRLADVVSALGQANRAILERNAANGTSSGTTVVAALWDDQSLHVAWAGDSRAYVLGKEGTKLLTRDHSVVQELVDAGLLSVESAARHPQSNIITRALGVTEDVTIDTISYRPGQGERLMLCSDGLSRSLDTCSPMSSERINPLADAMLAHALEVDGSDNVSFVIVEAHG